jgi:hypothetical protein
MVSSSGGTLSLYGAGFNSDCVVRLIGYGLLDTTFVNATALTARVPAGSPAGTYDVEVSDGAQTARLSRSFTLLSPTPTPKPEEPATPEPPPPPGQPILTVRNYTVTPEQVKPGQEFVVSIEIYNNGSRAGENTLAIFPGGTFVPLGEKGHTLWQLHINHTAVVTQRFRVPKSISNGIHQLNVQLEANDFAGNNYKFPTTVPVEVVGASSGSGGYTGKPKVVIEGVETTPRVLVPGEPFSLTLRLANRGSRTAVNVFATAAAEMVVPANGGDTVSTDLIRIDGVVTVTLPLMLDNTETGGRQNLPIALEYSDYGGGAYTDQQNVGVDVNTSLTRQPQVIIDAYTTTPDFLTPGATFTLTMELTNVGGGNAQRLVLALGGEDGAALAPFIPLRAGNVIFVPGIGPDETVVVERALLIDGSTDPKAYSLPIALGYDDPRAARHEDVQRLSLIVRKQPEVQVSFYRQPEPFGPSMPVPISLELVNVGRDTINITEISASSPGLDVREEGMPFVGPLDPGGSAPLDLTVTAQQGGPSQLVVEVAYRDDFNETQVLTRSLNLEVMGGPGGPEGPGGPGMPGGPQGPSTPENPSEPEQGGLLRTLGRFLRGFLGLGS